MALRAGHGAKPPVIFYTTMNDAALIVRAIEIGAQEYVMKPFDNDILLGQLSQLGLP